MSEDTMKSPESQTGTGFASLGQLVVGALGALFALGAHSYEQAPRAHESSVTFPASSAHGSDPLQLRAELFRPPGAGPFPAVILMYGCGGWQPAARFALRRHAEQLSAEGYVVLNIDSFGPRKLGGNQMCPDNARLRQALDYRSSDAFDGLRHLQSLDFVDAHNVFLMGQSNGGSVAIKVAQISEHRKQGATVAGFRAVVAYYPWCGGFTRLQLEAPLLVFGGGKDDWVSADECRRMSARGASLDVVIYPEAAHSFDLQVMQHRYNGYLVGHHPAAASDSSARMLAFFNENLTDNSRNRRAHSDQIRALASAAP